MQQRPPWGEVPDLNKPPATAVNVPMTSSWVTTTTSGLLTPGDYRPHTQRRSARRSSASDCHINTAKPPASIQQLRRRSRRTTT